MPAVHYSTSRSIAVVVLLQQLRTRSPSEVLLQRWHAAIGKRSCGFTFSENHAFAVYGPPQCRRQFVQWQIAKLISSPVVRKVMRLQRQAPVRDCVEVVDMMQAAALEAADAMCEV